MKRRKHIYFEYNLDGMAPKEIIKGFWKKYWSRWNKKRLKKLD